MHEQTTSYLLQENSSTASLLLCFYVPLQEEEVVGIEAKETEKQKETLLERQKREDIEKAKKILESIVKAAMSSNDTTYVKIGIVPKRG